MQLTSGEKLGPYEILTPLGEGGMGEVWKARDTRLDRTVALKVSKAAFTERFEREARSVAALNHPNICQLYDVGPNYLVMEFVEGTQIKGPLPLDRAVSLASQILDALDAAHRKGITHRDLKPANILVTRQGVKLLDFGLAKQAAPLSVDDATLTRGLTSEGQILGTLQYMAPEQLQGAETDTRSDLFSFGCVLYELLTGKHAFGGANAASVIAAILEREPAPLEVAPPLERIVRRALAKDPDHRFQTARDLQAALTWSLEQPPAVAASRRSPAFWFAATAAAAALLLAGWAAHRFSQTPAAQRSYRLQINPPEGSRFILGNSTGGIALSPDGRKAAFVASGPGKSGLWIRPLEGSEARLIPGTDGASYPFWSPDSESVGFFRGSRLLRADLTGGSPIVVCETVAPRGGAWSEDGFIIYGGLSDGLDRVSAAGGAPSRLTTLDASRGEGFHRWPQVLPGGRFLFSIQGNKPEHSGVFVSSFANPNERIRLMAADANALYGRAADGKSYLLWLRGPTLFAQEFDHEDVRLLGEPHPVADPVAKEGLLGYMNASVSQEGLLLYTASNTVSQFTWFDRAGKNLGTIGEPGEYSTFRLSSDGRRIAVAVDRPGVTEVWLIEVQRGVSSRFATENPMSTFPVWSPDGRTVVFSSGSPRNLMRRDSISGSTQQRLYGSSANQFGNDWSRDGRWLLHYSIARETQRDLWVLEVSPGGNVVAGASPKQYLKTPSNEMWGRFSPEPSPRWVAYQSDETGRWEIYVRSFPEAGAPIRISTAGGSYPAWSPSGRFLYYIAPDNTLVEIGLTLRGSVLEPSAPRELFRVPTSDVGWGPFDVSPDGNQFLVRAYPGQLAPPLTAVVGWPSLMTRPKPPSP